VGARQDEQVVESIETEMAKLGFVRTDCSGIVRSTRGYLHCHLIVDRTLEEFRADIAACSHCAQQLLGGDRSSATRLDVSAH
jgi:hypothetical protein